MATLTQVQPAPVEQEEADERTKSGEVRLGLVLYGGVSLAIYMNGIAQEFFRAVRGDGVFRLIKAVTDAEIMVDIISGASAGGINGIFLAYALVNGADFSECSKLWLEQGAIGKLLCSPWKGSATSLLDSEGYYLPKLQAAFEGMDKGKGATSKPLVNELDLFITGTDFYGETHTEFDDAGHPVDVKQNRSLFRLKHRARQAADGPNDFKCDPYTHQALGKLAQITSAFPFAFAPVTVSGPNDLMVRENEQAQKIDEKLRAWGKLSCRKHFVDGGVLANKPFTPTIEAIFNRAAEREVDRYLCYVDPDPECFTHINSEFPPQAFKNAVASLSTLPRYQSISADLSAIAEHNSQVEEFARFCSQQPRPDPADPWQCKPEDTLYCQARLMSISNRAVDGILKVDGASARLVGGARGAAAEMITSFDGMMRGASGPNGNASALLENFDIYFRRRRLFDQTYRIYDKLYSFSNTNAPNNADQYQELWGEINGRNKFLAVVQYHMERLIDEADFKWQSKFEGVADGGQKRKAAEGLWLQIQTLLRHLLMPEGNGGDQDTLNPDDCSPEDLDKLNRVLGSRTKRLVKEMPSTDPPNFGGGVCSQNVLCAADQAEEKIIAKMRNLDPKLAAMYDGFALVDRALFPAQSLSRLRSRDILKTVRFSPVDAEAGLTENLRTKVLGKQFGAFGGFLNKSWRANDICFGRLDGAAQLIGLLLNDKARARNGKRRSDIKTAILTPSGDFQKGMSPKELFPHSDPQQVRELIMDLAEGRWTDSVQNQLIEAAQIEIFYQELGHLNIKESTVAQFESEKQFLRYGYTVPQENWKTLAQRPGAVPVLVKGLAALSMVVLGLGLIQPFSRISKPVAK